MPYVARQRANGWNVEVLVKRFIWAPAAALIATAPACSTGQSLSGTISDARCGSMHDWDEHAPPLTERDCTLVCIKAGSSYVLVSDGHVYAITNQDHPGLAEHAGRTVRLTGTMQDSTLTVTRFDAP